MPDILLKRQTLIYIAENDALFPEDILYPSDVLYPGVRIVSNIVAGTLRLDELIAESTPVFGQLYATKFEVQVYHEENLSGKYIRVYQYNDNSYSDVFTGYIESCKLDKVGTDRTIVAYDLAYSKRQIDVTGWWNHYWEVTIPDSQVEGEGESARKYSTLGHARNAMLDYLQIAHQSPTLINDNLRIYKDISFAECTLQQMLGMMCELNCCFPHFDRNGYLKFIVLDPQAQAKDLSDLYEWMNSDFEDFTTQQVTGIQFYDSEDQAKYSVGNDGNAYPIKKNIFTYNAGTQVLTSIGNNMLPYLRALVYTPAQIRMIVGSFTYNLGDKIHTEKGDFYILQNCYTGSQFVEEEIKCPGIQENYAQSHNISREDMILNEKFSRIKYSVEGLTIEFGEYKRETDGTLTEHSSRITQNANAITAEVTRASTAEGQLSSRIQITADAIASEVSRATGAEKSIFANFRGEGAPTGNNDPSSDWTTTDQKNAHLGQVYYDTVNDRYYKYTLNGSTYSWQPITINTTPYEVVSSQIKQTADEISLKVSKSNLIDDINSELRIGTDAITITTPGKFIVTGGNFQVDADGTVTAVNANLSGSLTAGNDEGAKIVIDSGRIDFSYEGTDVGYISSEIHSNNTCLTINSDDIYIEQGLDHGWRGTSTSGYICLFEEVPIGATGYWVKVKNGIICEGD